MTMMAGLVAALPALAQEPAKPQRPAKPQAQPVSPQAATDPLTSLYHTAGVMDDGAGNNTGEATAFHCANYSTVGEKIRFVVREFDGTILKDITYNVGARRTVTAATHVVSNVGLDANLGTGIVNGGSALISANTTNMTCSAWVVDASASVPSGMVLHLQRFNPSRAPRSRRADTTPCGAAGLRLRSRSAAFEAKVQSDLNGSMTA